MTRLFLMDLPVVSDDVNMQYRLRLSAGRTLTLLLDFVLKILKKASFFEAIFRSKKSRLHCFVTHLQANFGIA